MLTVLALRIATRTPSSPLGTSNDFYCILSLSGVSRHLKSLEPSLTPLLVCTVWLAKPTCYFSCSPFSFFCICGVWEEILNSESRSLVFSVLIRKDYQQLPIPHTLQRDNEKCPGNDTTVVNNYVKKSCIASECAWRYYCHMNNTYTTGMTVLDIWRRWHLEYGYRTKRPVCTDLIIVLPALLKYYIWVSWWLDYIRVYIAEQTKIVMCPFTVKCHSHIALSGEWNSRVISVLA